MEVKDISGQFIEVMGLENQPDSRLENLRRAVAGELGKTLQTATRVELRGRENGEWRRFEPESVEFYEVTRPNGSTYIELTAHFGPIEPELRADFHRFLTEHYETEGNNAAPKAAQQEENNDQTS